MKMAPLHKKGNESECANYRPISIIFSKVMEKNSKQSNFKLPRK